MPPKHHAGYDEYGVWEQCRRVATTIGKVMKQDQAKTPSLSKGKVEQNNSIQWEPCKTILTQNVELADETCAGEDVRTTIVHD